MGGRQAALSSNLWRCTPSTAPGCMTPDPCPRDGALAARAAADIDVEGLRRASLRAIERLFRFRRAAELPQGRRQPAIDERMVRVGPDDALRHLDRAFVVEAVIAADDDLIDADAGARIARVEPDPVLQCGEALTRAAGED